MFCSESIPKIIDIQTNTWERSIVERNKNSQKVQPSKYLSFVSSLRNREFNIFGHGSHLR
jgi:hypothetical protein